MRFVEIAGGILQPVSIEETLVMDKIRGNGKPMPRSELDEREMELARNLVSRGLLTRLKIEGKTHLFVNDLQEI